MKNITAYPDLVTRSKYLGLPKGTKFYFDYALGNYVANYSEEEITDEGVTKSSRTVNLSVDAVMEDLGSKLKVVDQITEDDTKKDNKESGNSCSCDCGSNPSGDVPYTGGESNAADIASKSDIYDIQMLCGFCGHAQKIQEIEEEVLDILISKDSPMVMVCEECGNTMALAMKKN